MATNKMAIAPSQRPDRALRIASALMRMLEGAAVVSVVGGVIALIALASGHATTWYMVADRHELVRQLGWAPDRAQAVVTAVAIAFSAGCYFFARQLRAILLDAREGEAFAHANARRLAVMAWLLVLNAAARFAMNAALLMNVASSNRYAAVGVGPSVFVSLVFAFLLFSLSSVFSQGLQLREDVEGTV